MESQLVACLFSLCSDEGLTLENPALQTLYDRQFTLSTLLIKPNYIIIPTTDVTPQFL